MDVYETHIKEWAEVLAKVEGMVRMQAAADGKQVGSRSGFDGNSLEELAKDGDNVVPNKCITFLPSRQKSHDGHLLRLRKNKPEIFRKVVSGELTMVEARKAAGMAVAKATNLGRAQSG